MTKNMDLFNLINDRPHVRIGSEFIPLMDVVGLLDNLIDHEHQQPGETARHALARINIDWHRTGTIPRRGLRNGGRGMIPESVKPTLAFLTGSHAYGIPNEQSDIDLVVLCDEETKLKLQSLAKRENGQIRFESLQIIAFTNENVFFAWKAINDELVARKPVTRAEAVACFRGGIGSILDELYLDA